MSIGDRLKAARSLLKLTQEEMATKSCVSASMYQKYELGSSTPGGDAIAGFVAAGVNANWLLTGEGEMFASDAQAHRAEAVVAPYALQTRNAGLSPIYHLDSDLLLRVSERLGALDLLSDDAPLSDRTFVSARAAMRLIEDAEGDPAMLKSLLLQDDVVDTACKVAALQLEAARRAGR